MTSLEIFEHFAAETAPRPDRSARREIELYRDMLARKAELTRMNRLVERIRRWAAPRWAPTPLPPYVRHGQR